MILIIDHYDSFTYNIYQSVASLGERVEVCRYGDLTLDDIRRKDPQAIILSPGPGRPSAYPESLELIRQFHGELPLLGICLGQQLLAQAFGGHVIEAPAIRHGKVSGISHCGSDLFEGMADPLPVMRYHSLTVDKASLPACLEVQAEALDDGALMAIRHRGFPVFGLQFHPESIGTPDGDRLLARFVSSVIRNLAANV